MHAAGEETPLLRGRAAESMSRGGGASLHQDQDQDQQQQQQPTDGGGGGRTSVGLLPSGPKRRPALLAAAAVGAAVLTIAVALTWTSAQQAARPRRGDASLAATVPPSYSSGVTERASGRPAGGKQGGAVGRQKSARGAGSGERGGSQGSGGGWRSQGGTAPGLTSNARRSNDEGESGTSTVKPNVFFFLVDDMGYGDIGYQSSDLAGITPNLDKLAAGGVKLTKYYSLQQCTPARASILTGRYPVRYGLQYSVITPGAPWGLPLNEKILPQYMNEAGYESHMVGKWHLGSHKQAALPNRRGFKSYLGYLHGTDTYYSHKNPEADVNGKYFFDLGYGNATGYHDVSHSSIQGASCSDGRGGPTWDDISRDSLNPADVCYTGTYSTDLFVGRARQIVQGKTAFDEEPLFLYMAHQAIHSPLGPAPWDAFSPYERALLDVVRVEAGPNRARLAGVLMFLDKRIGAFVDMLEQEGWLENSVIVVASDNGACPSDGGTNYPLRGTKGSMYEGGTKVPAFVWSKSHLPADVWGTTYDKLMHATDWLPTLASLSGAEVKGSAGALDGVDHWDSITSNGPRRTGDTSSDPRTEMLYNWDPYLLSSIYDVEENRNLTVGAFRVGDWKLLLNVWCTGYYSHDFEIILNDRLLDPNVTCPGTGQCENCIDSCELSPDSYAIGNKLFNLRDDPREEHDLYHHYPEVVARLQQRAQEVVFSEWAGSGKLPVNMESYVVWKENGWWMRPWEEALEGER